MNRPLRVLLITNGLTVAYPLGGIERFVLTLARHLDRDKIEPIVGALWRWHDQADDAALEHLRDEGIQAFAAAPKDDRAPLRNFRQVLDGMRANLSEPVDVIHSHSAFGDPAALLLKRGLGASVTLRTVHNQREWHKNPLRRIVLTNGALPLLMDAEAGVSRQVVAGLDARPLARLLHKRALTLHNVVDFARFPVNPDKATARSRLLGLLPLDTRVAENAVIVGSIGRLTRQKGYDLLLQAMPAIVAAHGNVQLVLIGEGEERQALEAQVASSNLQRHVHFLGSRDDVEALLPGFDLYVSSSRWEGLPTVLLEAMACRVPVLATAVSGTTELIRKGETGTLIPAEDAAVMATVASGLLTRLDQLGAQVAAADLFARAEFSIAPVARRHEDVYRQLAGQRER